MRTPEIREPWTAYHDSGTDDDEGDGNGLGALAHIVEQAAAQADDEVREGKNVESDGK
jgi:hypothetical protein